MKSWSRQHGKATYGTHASPKLTPGYVLVSVQAVCLTSADLDVSGRSFSGTVLQTFEESPWPAGQKVWGRLEAGGVLSEMITVPDWSICKMKTNLTFEEASTLGGPGIMACKALQTASLPGDGKPKVLVHGANSGLGTFVIQSARVLKCDVEATAAPEYRDQCRDLGVCDFVDLQDDIEYGETLASFRGRRLRNFHAVIDTVSDDVSIYDNLERFTHEGAKYLTAKPQSVSWTASIKRKFSGSPREYAYLDGSIKKEDAAKWFQLVTRLINSPDFIGIEVQDEYAFEDVEAACSAVERNTGFGCVVVSVVDPDTEEFLTALAKYKYAGAMTITEYEHSKSNGKRGSLGTK